MIEATRALAALLGAGVPLVRALETARVLTGGAVVPVLDDVRRRVVSGEALATAMGAHPRSFPPLYVGVVRAGERAGDLAGAFDTLGTQLEREDALRSRLISSSLYPLLLLIAGGTAVLVLVMFVLPRFVDLLASSGSTLPTSTAALLAISGAVRRWWVPLVLALLALAAALAAMLRTREGRRVMAQALVRLPLVGSVRRYVLAARFARMTGVLLRGGTPVLAALDGVQASIADPLAEDEVTRIRNRVREGASLRRAIAEGHEGAALFPELLPRLVGIGEEASALPTFLLRAADICEERVERTLQRLVALAEPLVIVVFGIVVAFVALSLLQAIYGVDAGAVR